MTACPVALPLGAGGGVKTRVVSYSVRFRSPSSLPGPFPVPGLRFALPPLLSPWGLRGSNGILAICSNYSRANANDKLLCFRSFSHHFISVV